MDWQEIVERCIRLVESAHVSELKKIEINLEIGRIVEEVISDAKYGDCAVQTLAKQLSVKRGRTIYPQRLYEAYEVYSSVCTINKVAEIQNSVGEDITWNWLLSHATKDFTNTSQPLPVRQEKIQKKLRGLEKAGLTLDQFSKAKESLSGDEKRQVAGVAIGIIDSAQKVLESIGDRGGGHFVASNAVTDESNEKTLPLLGYFNLCELTGEQSSVPLQIHLLSPGGDIDDAVVVTEETHEKIHTGAIQEGVVRRIIDQRNINFAKLFLSLYVQRAEASDSEKTIGGRRSNGGVPSGR